ncbi:hypothetical protein HPP92_009896 [Vanilla planifolia]|uniref:Proline-rich protein n=1 Tax=Vanilla planifolia TaxID=51239 RepID=A0A835RH28_VANPL|nr:hypothetical protein HPP92_009896 [Vanilla planifolia]
MGKAKKKVDLAFLNVLIVLLVLSGTEARSLMEKEGKGGEEPPFFSNPQLPGFPPLQFPPIPGLSSPSIPGIPGVPVPRFGFLFPPIGKITYPNPVPTSPLPKP